MPPLSRIRDLFTITAVTVACIAVTALPAHAAPGDFDSTFGNGGKVTTDFGASPAQPEIGNDMVLQADRKIVAVGRAGKNVGGQGGDAAFGLTRYLPNGDLDPDFGTGGRVTTRFGPSNEVSLPRAVALQDDQKIVVGGWEGRIEQTADMALARYNTDGSLDTTFGDGGKVSVNPCLTIVCLDGDGLGDGIRDLRILPDGKILAIGANGTQNMIARFNSNGSLDNSFGQGGLLVTQPSLTGHLFAMELADDGKFLAAGAGFFVDGHSDFLLARYNADGSPDTTFGDDGIVTTDFTGLSDLAFELEVTSTGKIVAVGSAGAISPFGSNSEQGSDNFMAIARYNADGSLDTTFSNDGMVTKNLSNREDVIRNVAIQGDGKIVGIGLKDEVTSFPDDPETGQMAVVRYNTDGTLDTTFGTGGVTIPVVHGSAEVARGAAIDRHGRLVMVGGATLPTTGSDFAVVRLNLS